MHSLTSLPSTSIFSWICYQARSAMPGICGTESSIYAETHLCSVFWNPKLWDKWEMAKYSIQKVEFVHIWATICHLRQCNTSTKSTRQPQYTGVFCHKIKVWINETAVRIKQWQCTVQHLNSKPQQTVCLKWPSVYLTQQCTLNPRHTTGLLSWCHMTMTEGKEKGRRQTSKGRIMAE